MKAKYLLISVIVGLTVIFMGSLAPSHDKNMMNLLVSQLDHTARIIELEMAVSKRKEVYDPNAPIYSFMEVADPNWIRDYGDTEQTRHIYNTSKTRLIAAMMARRLLSLEAIHVEELKALLDPNSVDPNGVVE